MTQPRLDSTALLLLLGLALLWSTPFLFGALALQEISPLQVTFHRVVWAVPVLHIVLWAKGLRFPTDLRTLGAFLVMGGLNNLLPFTLIFWGQTQIPSGLASILNASTGLIGAVIAGIFLADERLTKRKVGGAVIGLIGVAVVMGPSNLARLDPRNLGQLAILGAATCYALGGVYGRLHLSHNPPMVNAAGMLTGSTILLLPVLWLVDGPPRFDMSANIWAVLLALSVLSTALAFLLYFAILKRAGAANLLLVTLLTPPLAILLGAVVLGETLAPQVWPGLALIALGLMVTDGRVLARIRAARAAPE